MKYLATLFCFFFQIYLFAQVEFKMLSLVDPDLKVCYAGITNQIRVIGISMDTSIYLQSNRGNVLPKTDGNNSEFLVTYSRGKKDTLRLFKGSKLLLEEGYEIRSIPDPIARLGNIKDNSSTVEEILKDPTIRIILEDCVWDHKCSFEDFDLILLKEDGNMIYSEKNVKGSKLTKNQIEEIKKLQKGDALIIKGIIAHFPDAAGRSMSPISINIIG